LKYASPRSTTAPLDGREKVVAWPCQRPHEASIGSAAGGSKSTRRRVAFRTASASRSRKATVRAFAIAGS